MTSTLGHHPPTIHFNHSDDLATFMGFYRLRGVETRRWTSFLGHIKVAESASPHLHFRLQGDFVFLPDFFLDDLDQFFHILGRAAGVGDEEIRVDL